MSGLALIAALAAQAATQTAPPPVAPAASPPDAFAPLITTGESTYVDLEAGAGYSTNPLERFGSDEGSAFGRISAHAVHRSVTDRTTTVLSAFGQSIFYTSHFGSAQSVDLNGRHDASVSEKLRLYVDGDFAYDRGGQLDTRVLGVPNVPLLPGTSVPPPLLLPGSDFLTVTGKTYRARGDFGGQLALGPRDFLDFSAGIEHDTTKEGSVDTRYTTIPVSIGYDRQLSERATVGARIAGQYTHYSGDIVGGGGRNVEVITPELTGKLRFSEQVILTGDIGASFSSVDTPTGTRHTTGLAADANLCSTNQRTTLCARGSVQEEATTSAGPTRVMSVGLDYSRQLSADDTISLSADVQRYSHPILLVELPAFSHVIYMRAAADYSRRLGNRWYAGVDLAARKVSGENPSPDADLSAALFIRYRFGDIK